MAILAIFFFIGNNNSPSISPKSIKSYAEEKNLKESFKQTKELNSFKNIPKHFESVGLKSNQTKSSQKLPSFEEVYVGSEVWMHSRAKIFNESFPQFSRWKKLSNKALLTTEEENILKADLSNFSILQIAFSRLEQKKFEEPENEDFERLQMLFFIEESISQTNPNVVEAKALLFSHLNSKLLAMRKFENVELASFQDAGMLFSLVARKFPDEALILEKNHKIFFDSAIGKKLWLTAKAEASSSPSSFN